MDKNPYNIFCIFFISISISFIFILFKRFINDDKNRYRIFIWSAIVGYTALLPYTILAFNLCSKYLPVIAIKKIPVFMALILVPAYVFVSKNYKDFFQRYNILPIEWVAALIGIIIYTAIFALQKNPNKQIHVAQYFLLSIVIYNAVRLDYKGRGIYVYVWYCASLMGVLDEFFQGIHNARYFSMCDMLSNSACSLGAVLFISCANPSDGNPFDGKPHSKINDVTISRTNCGISLFKGFYLNISGNRRLCYCIIAVLILGIAAFFNLYFLKQYSSGAYSRIYPIMMSIFILATILAISYKIISQRTSKIFSVAQSLYIFLALAVFFIIQLSALAVIFLEIRFI